MAVPYADLQLQYQSIKGEIDAAIAGVIRDNAFIRGGYVDAFEREFAAAAEVAHCVSCANGTDALYLAMRALNFPSGKGHWYTKSEAPLSTSIIAARSRATRRRRRPLPSSMVVDSRTRACFAPIFGATFRITRFVNAFLTGKRCRRSSRKYPFESTTLT